MPVLVYRFGAGVVMGVEFLHVSVLLLSSYAGDIQPVVKSPSLKVITFRLNRFERGPPKSREFKYSLISIRINAKVNVGFLTSSYLVPNMRNRTPLDEHVNRQDVVPLVVEGISVKWLGVMLDQLVLEQCCEDFEGASTF